MLKFKKTLFFILSFISGFILLTIYYYAESIFRHTEECTADWIIFNGQEQANLTLDFMYSENNKTGTVALSGTLLQKNKQTTTIRRDINYIWNENYDTTHFHSKNIDKLAIIDNTEDQQLSEILPDFYVYPDKNLSYNILTQGKHGFMFTVGNRAILYCSK
ncbi:hypothetical protein OM226_08465 [Escherichia albertii]|nr:hypothetical protein [Escherichia albertii]MCZ8847450.1 hypothetical protein [Escherichia albertii]